MTLINHVSCHDQQEVSDTALFLDQGLINHISHHDKQEVSDTALHIALPGSLINHVHPMTNSM